MAVYTLAVVAAVLWMSPHSFGGDEEQPAAGLIYRHVLLGLSYTKTSLNYILCFVHHYSLLTGWFKVG